MSWTLFFQICIILFLVVVGTGIIISVARDGETTGDVIDMRPKCPRPEAHTPAEWGIGPGEYKDK